MIRKLQLLCMFICVWFSVGFTNEANIFVLGYPRSGNHWSCYTLAKLMNIPCISHPGSGPWVWVSNGVDRNFDVSQLQQPLQLHAFYHGHNAIDCALHEADQSTDILIILLRDYKESIMSVNYDNEVNVVSNIVDEYRTYNEQKNPFMSRANSYFNILRCYECWDPQKRFLIYFEDLIAEPKQVLMNLSNFLDIDEAEVEEYLSNIEYHKERALDTTFRPEEDEKRKNSEDLRKHTKKMSKKNIKYIDSFVERNFPEFWGKYLSRYKYE